MVVLRVALLPIWPIALPSIYDGFSYLLAGDTFAHGRLANPSHALPEFFETLEVLQQPTYASRYPPGQGLMLAAGQVLFGHPWFGVWMSCRILLSALLWAGCAWLPRKWALAGPLLILPICLSGYWMNSYWGGAVAATGGTLMLGALGWLRRSPARPQMQLVLMALGAVILAWSRPFEGALLALPIAFVTFRTVRTPKSWLIPALVVLAGAGWLGDYNYRVTGSALKMPYQAYFDRYETIPPLLFLPTVEPGSRNYGHFNFELMDNTWMRARGDSAHQPGFLLRRAREWMACIATFTGSPLWTILLAGMLPLFLRGKETRFLGALLSLVVVATLAEPGLFAHYMAPFTPVFGILLVFGIRQLKVIGIVCFVLLTGYVWLGFAPRVAQGRTPDRFRSANAYRAQREAGLPDNPGGHVFFVHYTVAKVPHAEWIFNTAEIDKQKVIWAQDMGPAKNRELLACDPNRSFWYFEPDEPGASIIDYGQKP